MSLLPSTFPALDVHSGGAQIRRIPYNTIVLGSRSRGQTAYCVVGGRLVQIGREAPMHQQCDMHPIEIRFLTCPCRQTVATSAPRALRLPRAAHGTVPWGSAPTDSRAYDYT